MRRFVEKEAVLVEWEYDEEEAMKYRTWYHGTSDIFRMTRILPAVETGILREDWRKKLTDKVFFTDSEGSARRFARKAAAKYGGNPVVYVVKPEGEIIHVNTNEYVAESASIEGVLRNGRKEILAK